ASVPMAPSDPILGVTEAFVADPNPRKVNLGVGVYYDDAGRIPLLECVRHAESERLKTAPSRGYLPIDGLAAYDRAVQELVFGSQKNNVVTVQALGGTGGLRIGADFLRRISPGAQLWISDPSWENHRQLFEAAGFTVDSYPYYDAKTHGLDFAGMQRALGALPAGSIVVLHACCHNPTGVDLDRAQWTQVQDIVMSRGLVPFLDLAYQGFADGLEADFSFVLTQRGMFSYSGLSKAQVQRLRAEYSIYAIDTGRICVAALNSKNVDYVADAIAKVIE